MTVPISQIQSRVAAQRADIIQFLRDICAIPSMDSKIGPVGERVQAEMRKLKFDEVRFDKMGNTIGRIGNGPKIIVFDSHIDTVGVGDPSAWGWDPFVGKVEDGIFYARGACDEKNSTPGSLGATASARASTRLASTLLPRPRNADHGSMAPMGASISTAATWRRNG